MPDNKGPLACRRGEMESRKWEGLVNPQIIDQCIQSSVSWAEEMLLKNKTKQNNTQERKTKEHMTREPQLILK